jgi:hypothetical protein
VLSVHTQRIAHLATYFNRRSSVHVSRKALFSNQPKGTQKARLNSGLSSFAFPKEHPMKQASIGAALLCAALSTPAQAPFLTGDELAAEAYRKGALSCRNAL